MEKVTLTVTEAAQYLGVCADSIYSMVKEKQIYHFRIRNRILFRKEALDTWIQEQERKSYQAV